MTTQIAELSVEKLQEDVHTALKQWTDKGDTTPSLAHLQLFQQALLTRAGNAHQATIQVLEQGLAALATESDKQAVALRLRFHENRKAFDVARHLNTSESNFYILQRNAIQRLAELLYDQELTQRGALQLTFEDRLEAPTYVELVGIEQVLETLLAQVMPPVAPWLIALEGMGGIGKTSLANALMRRVIVQPEPFGDVAWVTARQAHYDLAGAIVTEREPALSTVTLINALWQQLLAKIVPTTTLSHDQKVQLLRTRLKQQPHLIVIDNLETVIDGESLLPLLQSLLNPTKFILTSRLRFGAGVGVYHFAVPALSALDALRLVRQEARLSNLPHLADATDAALWPIYETVGGNPLALRLVVGQTHVHALPAILADLQLARGAKVEQLYTYLYRWSWERLDESARLTWLAMPLLTEASATVTHLLQVTGLAEQTLRTALELLARLNLVNCQGDLNERRYTIHNLTRTFLQEQIAQWI